jgi:hypothetical protein
LLVMSQSPILETPPEELAVVDELDDPQAVSAAVTAKALISPMVRLGSMRRVLPTGKPLVAWG